MLNFPHWTDHLLAFLYCIVIPGYAAWQKTKSQSVQFFTSEQKKRIYVSGSFSLMMLALPVFLFWIVFKRPFFDLGFTAPINWQNWWWLVAIFIIIYSSDVVITSSSRKNFAKTIDEWKKRTPFLPTKNKELPEYFLLCISAGVFEEIIYRGFLITYCQYLFIASAWQTELSILLPAFVFSVAHFYQGAKAVLKIFILAIFFGYIYVYSGSLAIVMLLHFLVDAVGGLLTIKYMKDNASPDGNENPDSSGEAVID